MALRGGMATARSGRSADRPTVPCSRMRWRVSGGANGCARLLARQRVGGRVDEGAHLLAKQRVSDGCCTDLACLRRLLVQGALPAGLCSPAARRVGLRSRQCLTAAVAEEGQRCSLRSARVGVGPLTRQLVLRHGTMRGGRGEERGRLSILPLFAARVHPPPCSWMQRCGIVGAGDDAEWHCGVEW